MNVVLMEGAKGYETLWLFWFTVVPLPVSYLSSSISTQL